MIHALADDVRFLISNGLISEQLSPLLLLIADLHDSASKGENVWLSIGQGQKDCSILITAHLGALKAYARGDSFEELATDIAEHLL